MKKLLIICVLLSIISCSKDENGGTTIIGSGDLTMKINGTLWSGKVLNSIVDEKTEQIALTSLNLSANETMGIVIDDFTGVGTYPIPGDNVSGAIYARKDKVIFTSGKEITYKVTSTEGVSGSRKAHGTFAGTIKSSSGEVLTITEGKF